MPFERQYPEGQLNPQLVRHMEDQMATLVNSQGACERILKTPLPFAYVVMIKQLILVYLLSLPFAVGNISGWWSPLLMAIIALAFFGMEEASVETEDPFGRGENCLDMETFTMGIARDAGQMAATKSASVAIGLDQE
jgi:ion channel-forming bestrophin family protein